VRNLAEYLEFAPKDADAVGVQGFFKRDSTRLAANRFGFIDSAKFAIANDAHNPVVPHLVARMQHTCRVLGSFWLLS
jgi:hypothetical protein